MRNNTNKKYFLQNMKGHIYKKKIYTRRRHIKEKDVHTHKGEKYTERDIYIKKISLNFGAKELFDFFN